MDFLLKKKDIADVLRIKRYRKRTQMIVGLKRFTSPHTIHNTHNNNITQITHLMSRGKMTYKDHIYYK